MKTLFGFSKSYSPSISATEAVLITVIIQILAKKRIWNSGGVSNIHLFST